MWLFERNLEIVRVLTLRASGEVGVYHKSFVISAFDTDDLSGTRPFRFTPGERNLCTPLNRKLGDTQGRSDCLRDEKNVLSAPGLERRFAGRWASCLVWLLNLLKPSGHVMHQQFNILQLYVLPTLYLCVLYLSENKQRLVSLTA